MQGIDGNGKNIAKAYLIKRNAFSYEKVVRLVCILKNTPDKASKLYRYEFNPHRILDQIMLNPRLPFKEAKQSKEAILAGTGWKEYEPDGETKRLAISRLLRPPKELKFKFGD